MTNSTNRLQSLDVLRGITVAGMILVNDPGSWRAVYAPLVHAHWNGLTPTDLVFPFFMFIMGVSMYFSLQKFNFTCSKELIGKIFRRTLLIFLIGLGINWFIVVCGALFDCGKTGLSLGERLAANLLPWEHIRILGVLQRLALAYLGAALITLWVKPRYYIVTIAAILLGYWAILFMGNGFVISEENIIGVVDRALFGARHLYTEYLPDGTRIAFDPEGLLSAIPSFAHVLTGMLVGKLLMATKDNGERMQSLFIAGTVMLFAGFLLSYGCPINKKIWSPTYVLVTCGLASQLLALLIYIIDVKGYRKWGRFFEAFGVNPLFIYVLAEMMAIMLGYACFLQNGAYVGVQEYIYEVLLASWMNPYLASLVYALLFVLLNGWVANWLYKRKIYIKI